MKKILLTLVGLICSIGMWAATYKSVDGTKVFLTTSSNVTSWVSDGWVVNGNVSATSKKATINPETDGTIDFTAYDGINIKSGDRTTTFYLTNISELKIYTVNSSSSDPRSVKCVVTPKSGTAKTTYVDAEKLETAVIDITDLDAATEYSVTVEGFKSDRSNAADFCLYAIKAYGVSSGKVAPEITKNPVGASYMRNATATAFSVEAIAGGSGTLSYQWYSNTSNSTTGGTAISGATSSTYTPSTATIGTKYYYCVVKESGADEDATSTVAAVTVEGVVSSNATIKFSSTGAADAEGVYVGTMVSAAEISSENVVQVDDITFTSSDYRIKFGGKYTSSNYGRYIKVNVTEPCQISVYGQSNSGGSTRHISIGTTLGSGGMTVCYNDGKSVGTAIYQYENQDAGSVYIYPDETDFYVYAIKVTYGNTRSFTTSISGEKIGTFSAPYNTTVPEGVTAYTAAFNEDNSKLILTEFTGNVIPANTGVFVMGEKGSYTFEETTSTASASSCLTATAGNSVLAVEGNMVLSTYTDGDKTNAAMLPAATGLVINSYKAYLASSSAAKSVAIAFADDATTAISSVKNDVNSTSVKKTLENGKIVLVTPTGKYNAVGAQIK